MSDVPPIPMIISVVCLGLGLTSVVLGICARKTVLRLIGWCVVGGVVIMINLAGLPNAQELTFSIGLMVVGLFFYLLFENRSKLPHQQMGIWLSLFNRVGLAGPWVDRYPWLFSGYDQLLDIARVLCPLMTTTQTPIRELLGEEHMGKSCAMLMSYAQRGSRTALDLITCLHSTHREPYATACWLTLNSHDAAALMAVAADDVYSQELRNTAWQLLANMSPRAEHA